ncbi:putative G-protein coupled receptor 34a [Echeneis naucrates]|uniref:Probable G-protein coupled receptor 34 n=1 Tax=Echeneis naucrates TaxID=173247 RepID=A0A665UE57_ECHNA|nr:probable G-protein coupled receptor 34 [Echeneis naucrates]XP_029373167.1 probable G-protein coupled receptor 34 [Echeneis naucrates]XP_029373176.1 probable G-protein coupled receptor 34 [Echeneis naucrates]XP_029373185.1 probable G-protein coupled receptor 34 [Echeneis naucrates]XP_029373192.1 probable G-protein coupled receptor 34 [Echeneis naucrates]XP_029373201.1 probable G-protein coupled receptor 34 [Echeneis naucrates]
MIHSQTEDKVSWRNVPAGLLLSHPSLNIHKRLNYSCAEPPTEGTLLSSTKYPESWCSSDKMAAFPAPTSFESTLLISESSFSASLPSASTTPASSNHTNCSFDDTTLRLPLMVSYSLFFVFGLIGNLFALWVFLFLHSSRNSVRVFLINCAVADLVLLACLPFRVFYHYYDNKWLLGPVACKLVGNLFYMNMYLSILLLGLISLDRYLRLKGKGRARRGITMRLRGRNWPWSCVACTVLWGFSLIAVVPMIAMPEDSENNNQCFQFKHRQKAWGKAYFNAVLVLSFWLVFTMLVVSYAKIASQLLRVSRAKPDLPNSHKYNRTAKKSFFVLFLFTLCFGPYHAFRPVYILSQLSTTAPCDYLQMVDRTNEVMLLFSAFNSCLDPIMYFLLSGSVRKTALQVLGNHFSKWVASNSSTTEFRRTSVPWALPSHEPQTPSITPRTSICVANSTLRRTGLITLPPAGQQH